MPKVVLNQPSLILSILLLLIAAKQIGQNGVSLVKRKNSQAQRILYFDKKFEIKLGEESYNAKIIKVSETHVSVLEHHLKQNAVSPAGDKHPFNWVYDTLKIPIQQIDYIKAHRYKNRRWVIPFASVAALTIGSVFFTPLVSALKGRETADKLAVIQIGILAVTLPPVLIGTRKVKYDVRKKWKLNIVE